MLRLLNVVRYRGRRGGHLEPQQLAAVRDPQGRLHAQPLAVLVASMQAGDIARASPATHPSAFSPPAAWRDAYDRGQPLDVGTQIVERPGQQTAVELVAAL